MYTVASVLVLVYVLPADCCCVCPCRSPIRTEYKVAFPYLYNNRPRKVRLSVYHHPLTMYIKTEDPDLPAFYFDPLIHPIPFYKTDKRGQKAADEEAAEDMEVDAATRELQQGYFPGVEFEGFDSFKLPDNVEPFLQNTSLYSSQTASGIAILWAPKPFSQRSGHTRRACDVPLVNAWFQEHCPQQYPVKVRGDTVWCWQEGPGDVKS